MKNPLKFILLTVTLAAGLFWLGDAMAQTNTLSGVPPLAGTKESLPSLLITVVTPLIIAGVKWVVPRVPKVLLPIVAPAVGVALSYVMSAMSTSVNPWVGALLGLAGVGLREIVDQIKNPSPRPEGTEETQPS